MKKLTSYQKGYLEAMIDGEGSLAVRKWKSSKYRSGYEYVPLCTISNTDYKLLFFIKKIIGNGSIVIHDRPKQKNHKQPWRYNMTRNTMRVILPQLKLVIKEKQRKLVLKALEYTKGHKGRGKNLNKIKELETICQKSKILNKRGI